MSPCPLLYSFPVFFLASTSAGAQEKITFQDHIRPIFENRCLNCHNPDKKKGDLDLSTFGGVMTGGSGGASVEPGDSAASTLWQVVSHIKEPLMPPKGGKIPDAEIELIAKWIQGGLLDGAGSAAKVKKKAGFAMNTAAVSSQRPEGPPPMPENLLLEPVVAPVRPNAITAMAHSPWAPLVAIAAPRQVLLYQSATSDLMGVLPFPNKGAVETLSFSRNGSLLLAGGGIAGKEGLVVVWDVKTGQQVITLPMAEDFDTVLAADISADQSRIAMAGPGKKVRLYDTKTSQLLATMKKHTDWVTSLAFSPDGVLLATGDRNGGLYVWEAGTGNEFYNLRDHEKRIAALAWRADSNLLAAGSEDGNITWWEMQNGTQVKKIGSHGGVLALGFAPDGRMVSGGRDGHARVWDANGAQKRDWVPSSGSLILRTLFSDDGQRILTGAWSGEVKSFLTDKPETEAPPVVLVSNPPTIETRLTSLTADITAKQAALNQAAAAVAEKEKAAADLESGVTALRKTITETETAAAEAAKHREALQAETVKLQETVGTLAKTLEEIRKSPPPPAPVTPDTASMPTAVQAAMVKITETETTLNTLAGKIREEKIKAFEARTSKANNTLAAKMAEVPKVSAEVESLNARLEEMRKKMPEEEKSLTAAKQAVESLKPQLEAARQQASEITRARARWEAALQNVTVLSLREETSTLNSKLEDLRSELSELEAPAVKPTAQESRKQRLEEIKKELEILPAKVEAKKKETEEAVLKYQALLPK
ncbi:MAG: repeat-containing protein [Verrucomicrobiales bacterium]|nr:repeat-containing protein [Verrucomicrobiales bacterium]